MFSITTVLATSQMLLLLIVACNATKAFDIHSMVSIADSNIRTGNKILYEKKSHENVTEQQAATDNAGVPDLLDVNEIPVRFDETQLWRIYNISNGMRTIMPVAETLENKFGGTIWIENSKFLDISIGREHLKAARSFLTSQHIGDVEVLNDNVQDMIDNEQLMGVLAIQSKAGSRSKKATQSGMNWQNYHDLEVIYSFMNEIQQKFPTICQLYTIGKSAQGRDLKVLRISENPSSYKAIWIDGGIHAREWISPATVTFILNQLMANWDKQPDYMKKRTWYFMPVMNPDGYTFSRKSNRLWRKNRASSARSNCVGVDLNRNFNIGWTGAGSSTNPCSDTYRGTSAASELETKAVTKFLTNIKSNLASYLTFHSYGQMMVYPWAYKKAKVPNAAELQRVANTAVQRIKNKTGSIYRAAVTHAVLGIAGGGSDDWTRSALGTKYVYTVELRDRGKNGFVLPPAQIIPTGREGVIVVQTVAQAIK